MAQLTFFATVTAKPATRAELQAILAAQVEPTRAEPGCITYDFHVDPADPCVFVFYENWRTQADHVAHEKMPHLKPLVSQIDRLLACPVAIRHLRMLSEMAI